MDRIGFVGLGSMGLPMAVNIARAGLPLAVWNRTPGRTGPVLQAGAVEAESPEDLFRRADAVVLMLSGPRAMDDVLEPLMENHPDVLEGKIVANMGTTTPSYSRRLAENLKRKGAAFVDAPVSGTRVPAEEGALLVMAGGADDVIEKLSPVFQAVGDRVIKCGPVPRATMMKLANNIVLSASIAGLAEGAHFAKKCGLDMETFFGLILGGPLGNDIFAIKSRKIMDQDFSPQASIATVREMLKQIIDAAYEIDAAIPATLTNVGLIAAAMNRGLGEEDACAIVKVFER